MLHSQRQGSSANGRASVREPNFAHSQRQRLGTQLSLSDQAFKSLVLHLKQVQNNYIYATSTAVSGLVIALFRGTSNLEMTDSSRILEYLKGSVILLNLIWFLSPGRLNSKADYYSRSVGISLIQLGRKLPDQL